MYLVFIWYTRSEPLIELHFLLVVVSGNWYFVERVLLLNIFITNKLRMTNLESAFYLADY